MQVHMPGFVIKRNKSAGQPRFDLFLGHEMSYDVRVAYFGNDLAQAQVFTDRRQAVKILNMAGRGEFSAQARSPAGTWDTKVPAAEQPIDGLEIVNCNITRTIMER